MRRYGYFHNFLEIIQMRSHGSNHLPNRLTFSDTRSSLSDIAAIYSMPLWAAWSQVPPGQPSTISESDIEAAGRCLFVVLGPFHLRFSIVIQTRRIIFKVISNSMLWSWSFLRDMTDLLSWQWKCLKWNLIKKIEFRSYWITSENVSMEWVCDCSKCSSGYSKQILHSSSLEQDIEDILWFEI